MNDYLELFKKTLNIFMDSIFFGEFNIILYLFISTKTSFNVCTYLMQCFFKKKKSNLNSKILFRNPSQDRMALKSKLFKQKKRFWTIDIKSLFKQNKGNIEQMWPSATKQRFRTIDIRHCKNVWNYWWTHFVKKNYVCMLKSHFCNAEKDLENIRM